MFDSGRQDHYRTPELKTGLEAKRASTVISAYSAAG